LSNLSPETRALLDAARAAVRPTDADRDRIGMALRARIGDAQLPSDTQASGTIQPAPGAATAVGWPAISALVVGLIVAGGGLWYALSADSTKPVATTVTGSPVAAPPVVPAPVAVQADSPEISPLPPEVAPSPSAARRPSDRLAEEVAILSRAETELHAGRYSSALRVLDEHERKFPRGTLAQERLAAKIRALCGLGRTADADAALARLAPSSVHKGRTRAACAAGTKN
jgi:hypothetical protein